jgi:Polycystin cation channel
VFIAKYDLMMIIYLQIRIEDFMMKSYGSLGASSNALKTDSLASSESDDLAGANSVPLLSEASGALEASNGKSVSRLDLLKNLTYKVDRERHCRSVPLSILIYFLFVITITLHASIETSATIETGLYTELVDNLGFYPGNIAEYWSWFRDSLTPTLFNDIDRIGNGYSLLIGGLLIESTRFPPNTCPGAPNSKLSDLYGVTCYPTSNNYDTSPFGTGFDPSVASAFSQSTIGSNTAFQYLFDTAATYDDALVIIDNLDAGGWLDAATNDATVKFGIYNGEIGYYGYVQFYAQFLRGGQVYYLPTIRSVTSDPYFGKPGFIVLDILMMIYTLYLIWSTFYRLFRNVSKSRGSCCYRFSSIFTATSLLDMLASGSMIAMMICWFIFCARVSDLNNFVNGSDPSPASFSSGPFEVTEKIILANDAYYAYKNAAALSLVALTCRLFKYFAYQPRLAVMTTAFVNALSDTLHFAVLFLVICTMYGVWGYFLFGSQAPDWSSPSNAFLSVVRFIMYDYDIYRMAQTFPVWTVVYYVTFMLLITNLVLWMFLNIIHEFYSEARVAASQHAPSAFTELGRIVYNIPKNITSIRITAFRRGKNNASTWNDIIVSLQKGTLAKNDTITAGMLVSNLGVSETEAVTLINETNVTNQDNASNEVTTNVVFQNDVETKKALDTLKVSVSQLAIQLSQIQKSLETLKK